MSRAAVIVGIVLVLIACGMFVQANETCSWPWQDCYVGRE